MSTRNKILIATVLIFFVCVVVWAIRTTPTEPPPIEKFEPPTIIEYEGNTITEEQDGKLLWELTCDKMRIDTITQNVDIDGVKGKFYQYEGEDVKIWELTAATGSYDQVKKNILVKGDVVVTNSKGEQLLSDELEWIAEQELASASGNVNVTNSDGAQLLSDKLEWFAKQELVSASGNVKILNDDGAKLKGDKVEWFTAEEKVIATGDVRVSKDDMRGFGDLAYADNGFKHFGLLGNAKVLKGVKDMEEAF